MNQAPRAALSPSGIGTTLRSVGVQLRRRELSPVELTAYCLQRAREHNAVTNAVITISEEEALRCAHEAERRFAAGAPLSEVDGIPITLKDVIATAGVLTTNGSAIERNWVPAQSARVALNLRDAGAVPLGKANLHEYGMGVTCVNPHHGSVRNPWDTRLNAGGSSGGSAAAVVTRVGFGSVGTDTGGSVRIPAAHCGVFGLKPSLGTISTEGVTGISWSLDHVGPIAARVEDVAILFDAMVGAAGAPALAGVLTTPASGWRVGVPTTYFNERLEAEVAASYESSLRDLERLGAELVEVEVPSAHEIVDVAFTLSKAEAGYLHRDRFRRARDEYGDDVRSFLADSGSLSALDYITAVHAQLEVRRAIEGLFEHIDLLATPTVPVTAKPLSEHDEVEIDGSREPLFRCMIRYTSVFNVSGHPALSVPCGLTSERLPVGLQLVAGLGREATLVQAGYAYQEAILGSFLRELDHFAE